MRILRSLPAIIAATLITALPLAAPAQFTVGFGVAVGIAPPPFPTTRSRRRRTRTISGRRATGPGARPATTGCRASGSPRRRSASTGRPATGAPPAAATAGTPATGAPSVGFYGGINYGYGYPGTGFYGGAWAGGSFGYNTAVANVNRTVIHNTYNKTVVNKNVCNNCKNVSFNGGHGGMTARATNAQVQARRNGDAADDRSARSGTNRQHRIAISSASVNKGKPSVTASDRAFNDQNKPKNFAPVTAADRQNGQRNNAKRTRTPLQTKTRTQT